MDCFYGQWRFLQVCVKCLPVKVAIFMTAFAKYIQKRRCAMQVDWKRQRAGHVIRSYLDHNLQEKAANERSMHTRQFCFLAKLALWLSFSLRMILQSTEQFLIFHAKHAQEPFFISDIRNTMFVCLCVCVSVCVCVSKWLLTGQKIRKKTPK